MCWISHMWSFLRVLQMRHLFDTGESREMRIELENVINTSTPKLARNGLYLFIISLVYLKTSLDVLIDPFRILLQSLLLKCNNELFSL